MAQSKDRKRRRSAARTRLRSERTPEQQLEVIGNRRGNSKMETQRLTTMIVNRPIVNGTTAEEVQPTPRGIKKRLRNLAKVRTQRKRGR